MKKTRHHNILLIGVTLIAFGLTLPVDAQARQTPRKKPAPSGVSRLIAPALIPGTRPEMNSPGFWIGRHPFPDRVLLDAKGIEALNAKIRNELKVSYDLASYPPTYRGSDLASALLQDQSRVSYRKLYNSQGTAVDKAHLDPYFENQNLGAIPAEIKVGFGLIVKNAEQRVLPTAAGLYLARINRDFDRLQNSVLDIGTPVALLHTSRDGEWRYIIAPSGEGWVQNSHIATCAFEDMKAYVRTPKFIVITASKGDLYLNRAMTVYGSHARMGQRLPLRQDHGEVVEVLLPDRNPDGSVRLIAAFLRKRDVHIGYLPYTPRTIIYQAFEFLNSPYGWGDLNGEQDCSSFIRGVFATTGVELPRNSLSQSQTGRALEGFNRETPLTEKNELLRTRGIGGVTLLRMTGHIMLYLGTVDATAYAIHGMYGYHTRVNNNDVFYVVNRIVVTDLNLEEETRSGPFLEKIDRVRIVE